MEVWAAAARCGPPEPNTVKRRQLQRGERTMKKMNSFDQNRSSHILVGLLAITLVAGLAAPDGIAMASEDPATEAGSAATSQEAKSTEQQQIQGEVDKTTEIKTDEARGELVKETVAAVNMTRKALALLSEDEPKTDEAIAELEIAVGKLEIQIARDPNLAMVPVAVNALSRDVLAQVSTVEKVVDQAKDALDDGRIQEARRLLDGLASEYVVSTSLMPLATYPDAIRKAVPLIDAGEVDEAKMQIQTALNLLYIEDSIYPLPVLRVQEMVATAETLAEKPDRSDDESTQLIKLLKASREEIKLGMALGYYDKDAVKPIFKEIEKLEAKTDKGRETTENSFDKIKKLLSGLT